MSEWISVKDRLPNDGEEVLIHDGSHYLLGVFKLRSEGFYCGTDYQGYDIFYIISTINYWCSLPEPPKG